MGLDMFAYTTTERLEQPVDFFGEEGRRPEDSKELFYWRKHPNLHGWMERRYHDKGGQDENFNVSPMVVSLEDLANLEQDVLDGALPKTSGFFFGESRPEDMKDDLEFIEKAREAIAAGLTVYYYAWW